VDRPDLPDDALEQAARDREVLEQLLDDQQVAVERRRLLDRRGRQGHAISPTRLQRAQWCSPTCTYRGSSHTPGTQNGQRGWNAQRGGTEYGSGTMPRIDSSRSRDLRPSRGIERSSALV